MRIRLSIAILLVILFSAVMLVKAPLYLSAKSQYPETTSQTADVNIDNFSFAPGTVTVAVGTTVTWTNRDDIPHTVVNTDGMFKSKVMDSGEKFAYQFTKPGTFPYFCSVHPKMTGKVVVQSTTILGTS
jgi:plastocyanin